MWLTSALERLSIDTREMPDERYDQIERTLTGQQVDAEVERWMREARRRTAVVYHDEVFQ